MALIIPSRDSVSNYERHSIGKSSGYSSKNSRSTHFKDSKKISLENFQTSHSSDCKNQYEAFKSIKKNLKQFKQDKQLSVLIGVEILAKNPSDLKKQVQKFRKRSDVILVHGGDLKVNRAATEDPRIDILCHPYRSRYDAGINHVLATKAAENQVAIELNLKYYLLTRPNQRHRVLSQFRSIVKLHRKYKFPVIITSGAESIYDLRNPRDVIALASCFGMTKNEANEALSTTPQKIIDRNRIRDQVIVQGVRLIRE
ncbi:MAG: ribonuclease P [Methanobacteriaceae archaeon]|nr:ribonuclease P [Methanobacteriaceae archaeon]